MQGKDECFNSTEAVTSVLLTYVRINKSKATFCNVLLSALLVYMEQFTTKFTHVCTVRKCFV